MKALDAANDALEVVEENVHEARRRIDEQLDDYRTLLERLEDQAAADVELDEATIQDFAEEPYCIVPTGDEEWRVVVPRFVDYQVGILEQTTPSFNIFRVNKYAKWLVDIPDELEERFHFHDDLDATFDPDTRELELGSQEEREEAWDRYRDHLWRREDETTIKANDGSEFDLLADLIDDGILPFQPQPVQDEDLREPRFKKGAEIELRDYQEGAWETFLEKGAIGVYWPPGTGKTFLALYACAHLRGKKIVVVPSRTLVEQWQERIRNFIKPFDRLGTGPDVEVLTYQSWSKLRRRMKKRNWEPPTLVIFDECHRLPATTFSKFSTLPMKYRMGLSATPYREDGRTDYIFALSGFPVGLEWERLVELGVTEKPDVTLHEVPTQDAKENVLSELLDPGKKTIVFCDSLDRGQRLADYYGMPFVNGQTTDRLDTVRENQHTIVSRVGDEGLSVDDLGRVVEIDFLGASRRQEGQRMGRLFHGDGEGDHHIMMTREELAKYEDRLLAIQDKGIRIQVEKHREESGGISA
jgi:DNA excision repair protein ERCC-3